MYGLEIVMEYCGHRIKLFLLNQYFAVKSVCLGRSCNILFISTTNDLKDVLGVWSIQESAN